MAYVGFFAYLANHPKNYPCQNIFVECKNYSGEPGNPELDQLSGRFSPRRGMVGLLVCRSILGRKTFAARCRDTADDGRGYIIALDDEDLRELVSAAHVGDPQRLQFRIMKAKFDTLIM
jgi:hypothetical protein